MGGPGESRAIDRRQRLVDIYSRLLLLKLEADVDRLNATAAEAQRRHAEARRVMPAGDHDPELVTAELAQAAELIIHEAGADVDLTARKRLLTATDYQTSRDVFGTLLGDPDLAGPPNHLIAELDRIDTDDKSEGG